MEQTEEEEQIHGADARVSVLVVDDSGVFQRRIWATEVWMWSGARSQSILIPFLFSVLNLTAAAIAMEMESTRPTSRNALTPHADTPPPVRLQSSPPHTCGLP